MARSFCLAMMLLALWISPATAQPAFTRSVDGVRLIDLEGRAWNAEQLRGRVTVIDFWATWCPPCLAEIPYLKQARARFAPDEFQIIGVSLDVIDRRGLVSWLNRQNITWPQVFDGRGRQGPSARMFGVTALPTTFLIDEHGRIIGTHLRGGRLLDAIEERVDELRERRAAR